MAIVYLARQRDLARDVALKELAAFHATDPDGVRRFQRSHNPKGLEFAAQIALYPPCGATYREDEQVAGAMGISTTKYKLLAFAIGGAIGATGGGIFAVSIGSLQIASFQILVSITALAIVILGGLGSIPGVVVRPWMMLRSAPDSAAQSWLAASESA